MQKTIIPRAMMEVKALFHLLQSTRSSSSSSSRSSSGQGWLAKPKALWRGKGKISALMVSNKSRTKDDDEDDYELMKR